MDENILDLNGFLRYVEDCYSAYVNGDIGFNEWCFEFSTPAVPLGKKDWTPKGETVEVWGCADTLDGTPLVFVKHLKKGDETCHLWELSLRRNAGVGEPLGHREPSFSWSIVKVDYGDWDSIIEDQLEDFIWDRRPVILI